MYVSNHWHPSTQAQCAYDVCKPPPPPEHPLPMLREGFAEEGGGFASDGVATPVPLPVLVPTLIIWYSDQCGACTASVPTFTALEELAPSLSVYRRPVDAAVMRRYPGHIISLPTYDFLYPDPSVTEPSNRLRIPGVRMQTVRENHPENVLRFAKSWISGAV
jgi:hypothetical protein